MSTASTCSGHTNVRQQKHQQSHAAFV